MKKINSKHEQITIRLPIELKEELQREADIKGYTIKDLIIFAIQVYFQSIVQG